MQQNYSMMMKEKIKTEDTDRQLFEVKMIEPENSKPASFTHYLHNQKHGVLHTFMETSNTPNRNE